MFKHFILTRFNLGIYDKDSAYADKVGNPAGWMAHRMELFERYCLPTFLKQTCQNFTWVIAFAPETPREIILKYDYIENVQIIYEQPHLWLRKQKPETDWLITSRMDNDDQYSRHFVEMIQAAFDEKEEIIDIMYQVVDLKTKEHYPSYRRRNNSPFLSLVEPWTHEPMTAMGRPHTNMVELYPSRRLENILAFQLIHDRNICNKIPI